MAKREVYRIQKGKGPSLAFGLAVIALLAEIGLGITDAATFWGVVAAAVLVGYLVGRTIARRSCSGCGERLTRDDEVCPGCDGIIKGNVTSASQAR